ncbi:hypothetical protein Bca101_018130 [Brassica carinata]
MASRKPVPSVKHPSHKHPLHIFKAQEEDEIICSGCELEITGEAFKCTKSDCDYFLHKDIEWIGGDPEVCNRYGYNGQSHGLNRATGPNHVPPRGKRFGKDHNQKRLQNITEWNWEK